MRKVKTIDITALEWFDKANGNSYFAGIVTINFGTKTARIYKMPFEYGYGDYYKQAALKLLKDKKIVSPEIAHLHQLTKEGIIIRSVKHENCKKRELTNI